MTDLEHRAFLTLSRCRLRLASGGKRFVREYVDQPETKLTELQAIFLWGLVHMYRRQIPDAELLRLGAQTKATGELPVGIYQPGDHREAVRPRTKVAGVRVRAAKLTRYEAELARGGGRLAV